MKRVTLGLVLVAGAAFSSSAAAEDQTVRPTLVGPMVGTTKGYIMVDPPSPVEAAQHFSRILFLNRCASGCNITFGTDNSSTNRSSIAQGNLSPWNRGDNTWNQVVACVQEIFAPFDVQVTDVDPGATEHMEAMVAGGSACEVSNDPQCSQILGFAPATCGYIPRSISYTFANNGYFNSNTVNEICATIGQEAAHTWGLDHEYLASDPMTYLPYSGRRHFQNMDPRCGEFSPRNCYCGGATQNSYDLISQRFGTSVPTPPGITITSPQQGASVEPGFPVRAEANEALVRAELYIDNQLVQTITLPPYAFNAPMSLGEGTHQVRVTGYDAPSETPGSAMVSVNIGEPCEDDGDCDDQGDNLTCVGGRCVLGEDGEGGLGDACTTDEECFSNLCLSDGVEMRCVESCVPDSDDCPGGYDCLTFDSGGVCWPGQGGGGGCSSSGPGSALPIGLGLLFGSLLLRRRRRA